MDNKQTENKKPRLLHGVVTKIIDETTAKVRVEIKQRHPLYEKIVSSHKNYLVHITTEDKINIGDEVEVRETSPISKNKTWRINQITKRAA